MTYFYRSILLLCLLFCGACGNKPEQADRYWQDYRFAMDQNEKDRAQDILVEAIDSFPKEYRLLLAAGKLFNELGFPSEAQKYLRRAATCNPDAIEPLFELAQILKIGKRYKPAEVILRKALALEPHNTSLNNNIGNILVAQEKHSEALAFFQKSLQQSPTNSNTLLNLGLLLSKTGQSDSTAVLYLEQFIEQNPQDGQMPKIMSLIGSLRERRSEQK